MRSPLFFLSLHTYMHNTIYIHNFYFVILSIFSIFVILSVFSISFMSFSISTDSPNITILALLNSRFYISFISSFTISFTISFNLSILYHLYHQICIIQIFNTCKVANIFGSIHILCQNSLIFLLFLSLFRHYTYTNTLLNSYFLFFLSLFQLFTSWLYSHF